MTKWKKLGDPDRPIYRTLQDPKAMHGVKRIDVTYTDGGIIVDVDLNETLEVKRIDMDYSDEGTLIITVETEEGTMAANLHEEDR